MLHAHDLHSIWELNDELATPIYLDIAYKIGKEWGFDGHLLYQLFMKWDYTKLIFNEGCEEKALDVYHKISQSYLHKDTTNMTTLP